jgi:hypothetical protein
MRLFLLGIAGLLLGSHEIQEMHSLFPRLNGVDSANGIVPKPLASVAQSKDFRVDSGQFGLTMWGTGN